MSKHYLVTERGTPFVKSFGTWFRQFGWSTAKMATHYTRAASRKVLAKIGPEKLLRAHMERKTPAP